MYGRGLNIYHRGGKAEKHHFRQKAAWRGGRKRRDASDNGAAEQNVAKIGMKAVKAKREA